jgi:predicted secreted protein
VADNSTYPTRAIAASPLLRQIGQDDDPSVLSSAVLSMLPHWEPIDICVGGTRALRSYAEKIIPREPSEAQASYERRIFHATLPPFLNRLASQAAGIILRKGIQVEGDDYWQEWIQDVTGDGTTLNEYARRQLITALLYGHSSTIVDYAADGTPRTLAEERRLRRKPYLVPVAPSQILGWRTMNDSTSSELAQVRIKERVVQSRGAYGEELVDQIRVMTPGGFELWRTPATVGLTAPAKWDLAASGRTSLSRIPLVTVYSNRIGNLLSKPPLEEVAYLCIAYAQRFCDFHHAIHVSANPMLVLRGFDPDSDTPIGISVNTALLLPPDGGAEFVEPTSEAFDSQLKCLKELEDQIGRLGINTLSQANMTNAAAEARRIDRIDSDSIMAVISGDLERTIAQIFALAAEYVGIEPPEVTIPRDYDNRFLSGNEITSMLQLFMQGAISQETLLRILQDGEVLPATMDIDAEVSATTERLAEQQAMERLATGPDMAFQAPSDNAGQGESLSSQTLPTPMRPGRNAA